VTKVGDSQKTGGIAALIGAVTVVIGLAMFAFVLSDYASGDPEPAESVAFLADNHAAIFFWNLITLIAFSVVLVVISLALNRRLKAGSSLLAQTATAFGIIWAGLLLAAGMIINIGFGTVVDLYATSAAQAEALWLAIDSVGNGMSGGMEIAGPMWVLLVSIAALQTGALPKALNWVGILIAAGGLVTIIPALETVGAIFGLGLIVWLTWLGIVMLRTEPSEAT
jgi:hypothetical protein